MSDSTIDLPAATPATRTPGPALPTGIALSTVTLDSPDPRALGRFYAALLGGRIDSDDPGWVSLTLPNTSTRLAFQPEEHYVRPTWPAGPGDQQMMVHLEIKVDDLGAALAHAEACGARAAEFQPQPDVRVCLDPDGHPFCLWIES